MTNECKKLKPQSSCKQTKIYAQPAEYYSII